MAMPTSLASSSAAPGAASAASTVNGSAVSPADAATDLFAGLEMNRVPGGGGKSPSQKPPQVIASTPNNKSQQSKADVSSPNASLSLQDKHR